MATCVFDELLARRQKWWPKWHPLSTVGALCIRLGLQELEEQYDSWVLISYDHKMVFSYWCGRQQN